MLRLEHKEEQAKVVLARAKGVMRSISNMVTSLDGASKHAKTLGVVAPIDSHKAAEEQKLSSVQHVINVASRKLKLIAEQRAQVTSASSAVSTKDLDEKSHVAMLRQHADTCSPGTAVCDLEKEDYQRAERRLWMHEHLQKMKAKAESAELEAHGAARIAEDAQQKVKTLQTKQAVLQQRVDSGESTDEDNLAIQEVNSQLEDSETAMWDALKDTAEHNTAAKHAAEAVANAVALQHVTSAAAMPLQQRLFHLYASGKPGNEKEIAGLSAQIKKVHDTGDAIYRSVEEKKASEALQKEMSNLPESITVLSTQIEALRTKADATDDAQYHSTLMESARTLQKQMDTLRKSAEQKEAVLGLERKKTAAEKDRKQLWQTQKSTQETVDALQATLDRQLHKIQSAMSQELQEPQQAQWETMVVARDGLYGLELIGKADAKRTNALLEAFKLLKPESDEIRDLYARAPEEDEGERDKIMAQAEQLWHKMEDIQDSMLEQDPIDTLALAQIKQELNQDNILKRQLESDTEFLQKKVNQLSQSIKGAGSEVSQELQAELFQDERQLQKKNEKLFFAEARAKFTQTERVDPLTTAADVRKNEREAAQSTASEKMQEVYAGLMSNLRALWHKMTKQGVVDQKNLIYEELRRAQEELIPGGLEAVIDVLEPEKEQVTIPANPKASVITQSPLAWEQALHNATHEDVLQMNALLRKQLASAQSIAKDHAEAHLSVVDQIENLADDQFTQALEDGTKLDCQKYPVLCQVGKNDTQPSPTEANAVPEPPPPDPTELARKLVSNQGKVVGAAQTALSDLIRSPNVDMERQKKLEAELAEQSELMQKAEAHLTMLESNQEETMARKSMKDAKIVVDTLTAKLQRLKEQDPAVQKSIDKIQARLETATDFFDDEHFKYVKLLNDQRKAKSDEILEAQIEVKKLTTRISNGGSALPDKLEKWQKSLESARKRIHHSEQRMAVLDEAKLAAGPVKEQQSDLWVPTKDQSKQLDEAQLQSMKEVIGNITMSVILPQS